MLRIVIVFPIPDEPKLNLLNYATISSYLFVLLYLPVIRTDFFPIIKSVAINVNLTESIVSIKLSDLDFLIKVSIDGNKSDHSTKFDVITFMKE